MTLSSYTRDDLVQGLRDHFGLQNISNINDMLVRALDDAVEEIVRKRRSWHFLERPLVIDVGASKSGTATFTQGSSTAVFAAGTAPAALDVLADEDTTNITKGFRVVSYGAPNIVLDAAYVPASGLKSYTAVQGWFPLPANFVSMDGPLWDVEDLDTKIRYRSPPVFENIVRNQIGAVGKPAFYTVVADPRAEDDPQLTDRLSYLVVYPYVMSRTTLRGKYQVHPQKLNNASAIPIIPREYRGVLIDWARWTTSVRLRLESPIVQSYLTKAQNTLADMLKEYEYVDDPDDGDYPETDFDLPIEGSSSIGDNFQDFV